MPAAVGAPAQHKQPSRKGKKAWRKNVDITEVQDGLEALRDEVIQGGPFSEKPSEELFELDVIGSQDIKTKYQIAKPLKVDEILAKRSAVPAVDSYRNKRGHVTDGVIEHSSKRTKPNWVSKKEVARLRQVADRTSHLNSGNVDETRAEFDLWASRPSSHVEATPLEYVASSKPKVAPATIKRAPQSMTADGKPVRAVVRPDAGTSYNPSFDDWEDLLTRKGAEEVIAEQSRLQHAQTEEEKQARIAAAGMEDVGVRTDNESEWEGFDTEAEEPETLTQRRPKRKTPAERNRINRRKEVERLAKHEQRMGEKQRQAEQMFMSMTALTKTEGDVGRLAQDTDEESGDETKLRRRKMGNQPIPERSLELVLPDELQESLRQLKPEGNLLQDRFRNLLVNGKIESRRPVLQSKKKKVKVTEKWSYKDFSVTA